MVVFYFSVGLVALFGCCCVFCVLVGCIGIAYGTVLMVAGFGVVLRLVYGCFVVWVVSDGCGGFAIAFGFPFWISVCCVAVRIPCYWRGFDLAGFSLLGWLLFVT